MPYWKRKSSKYFYGRAWDAKNGRYTADRSLKVTDDRAADAALRQWERDLADPAGAAAKRYTVKEALDGLGKHLTTQHNQQECAADTVDYHAGKAGPLARLLGTYLLAEVTPTLVGEYRTARKEEKASGHSATKELRTLRYAMRIAKLAGQYSGDLEAVFPRMPTGYTPRARALSEGELLALLWEAGDDIGAQIAFAVATSAEAKAISTARQEDIHHDQTYVLLRGTKRETRWRTVPIVTDLQRQLIAYTVEHAQGEEGLLFGGTRWGLITMLRKLSKRLGMTHVTPNDLRRTFATMLREGGVAIELIAPLMGHADTQMLQRVYGRLSPEALAERISVDLNASAAYSQAAAQQASITHNGVQRQTENTSKMEPTGRFERPTYGLRIPLLITDTTVNPPTWRMDVAGSTARLRLGTRLPPRSGRC